MARLLLRGETYESVSPNALFEGDYERLLLTHRDALYPHGHLVPFKCNVDSEFGRARADLALIDKSYRKWWVVEVETADHSLEGHVEPQVRALANGKYGADHARYLSAQSPDLDHNSLSEMVRGAQPRVLVLVNRACPEWIAPLRRWDARIGIVEIFRSPRSVEVLRINGEHPEMNEDVLSACRIDPILRRSLVIDSPAALPVEEGGLVQIWYEGGVSDWKRVSTSDVVWLMPIRRSPLPHGVVEFSLVRDGSGQLRLINSRSR